MKALRKAETESSGCIIIGLLFQGCTGWPVDVLTDTPDIESITEHLHSGPYGRCVYDCNNDVVDHQVLFNLFLYSASF